MVKDLLWAGGQGLLKDCRDALVGLPMAFEALRWSSHCNPVGNISKHKKRIQELRSLSQA